MDNSTSELLYVAYKNLLTKNIKSGLLGQHLSDSDYYALDKMPKLLFHVLDEFYDRYNTKDFLQDFYKLNPHRYNDYEFSKEVLIRLRDYKDVKVLLNGMDINRILNDIPLLEKAFNKIEGDNLITLCGIPGLNKNQAFMESIYNSDKFSLTYFDLPAPTDEVLIKNILAKDPRSYSKLNDSQKNNKEYLIIALENTGEKATQYVESNIYPFIPEKLKEDKDVVLLTTKRGCVEQPLIAFTYENTLSNLLNSIHNKKNRDKISNFRIDLIPVAAYKNSQNILELFTWMDKEKENIDPSYENYAMVYKLIKAIAKTNTYVKEQVTKQGSHWNQGSLGEVKNGTRVFFRDYFEKNIPEMTNELRYYVMADQLNKDLDKNEERVKRLKL
jgi:hypothetical protein